MENVNFEKFIRILEKSLRIFEYFLSNFEEIVKCEKIKNFHQSETKQSTDLPDLRQTWKEMRIIFWRN